MELELNNQLKQILKNTNMSKLYYQIILILESL